MENHFYTLTDTELNIGEYIDGVFGFEKYANKILLLLCKTPLAVQGMNFLIVTGYDFECF